MTSALLVVDMQNDVIAGVDSRDETVATITRLVDEARERGTPVIWVQHEDDDLPADSHSWQIAPELAPAPGETLVIKRHRSSFADTGLGEVLRGQGVDRVVLAGAQSAFCVDMTGKHALAEGFAVTLVSDAHCNGAMACEGGQLNDAQVRGLINRTWATLRHPGLDVRVCPAADVVW